MTTPGELVRAAEQAASKVFHERKTLSPWIVRKATVAAYEAIRRVDPLAGTKDHPVAPYARGVHALASEGVEVARRYWAQRRDFRLRVVNGIATFGPMKVQA